MFYINEYKLINVHTPISVKWFIYLTANILDSLACSKGVEKYQTYLQLRQMKIKEEKD